jgi:methionyl-tRNA formyltransferase
VATHFAAGKNSVSIRVIRGLPFCILSCVFVLIRGHPAAEGSHLRSKSIPVLEALNRLFSVHLPFKNSLKPLFLKPVDTNGYRVLFLRKKDNEYAQRAEDFIRSHYPQATIFSGHRKDRLPPEVINWKGDLMISFISSWIYPATLLENARYAAINFHPGSPEYPGTGCTNFAVYHGAKEYGITCHHMKAAVDSGHIIQVKRFPVADDDTVYSVTQRCYHLIEESFYEIMQLVLNGEPLPVTNEAWKRKPYTRKQLDDLCHIRPDMSPEEVERRIKATTYKTPWAFTKIGDHIFKLLAEHNT